jgi:hypothetical protein
MDLAAFKKKTAASAWFIFDAAKGMKVELLYISPEDVRRSVKDCTTIESGRETLDQEKLLKQLASRIKNWEGFTLERVAELIDIEIPDTDEGGNKINLQSVVTCSEENKLRVLKESWVFKPFIEQKTVALNEFKTTQLEEQRKNSGSSPSGSSAADSPAKTAEQ